jgi:hypothetical protein
LKGGAFAKTLPSPLFYDSGRDHYGFRYGKPDLRHFCLLKGIRAVSGLNAAVELVRTGYTQEFVVLLRTVVEYRTHIEFVLSAIDKTGNLRADAETHVQDYFSDFARNSAADFKRSQLRQGAVHDSVGAMLRSGIEQSGDSEKFTDVIPSKLLSNVYLNFSNYVHARYPEVMDLFGGSPPSFHLRGMSGTPKDSENLELLDSSITSMSLTLKLTAQKLNMANLIQNDTALAEWFRAA